MARTTASEYPSRGCGTKGRWYVEGWHERVERDVQANTGRLTQQSHGTACTRGKSKRKNNVNERKGSYGLLTGSPLLTHVKQAAAISR